VFNGCVDVLLAGAAAFGISYNNAINVLIFCILWPLATIALIAVVLLQGRSLRRAGCDCHRTMVA
jgi:hypothetical protein